MLKNLIEDQGRNALLASIGSTTTKAGASASVLGWLISQEGLAFVGAGVAIIGLGVNWYYKRKEDRRAQEEHDAKMRELKEVWRAHEH